MFVGILQTPLHLAHADHPHGAAGDDYGQQKPDQRGRNKQQVAELHLLIEQPGLGGLTVEFLAQRLIHILNGSNALGLSVFTLGDGDIAEIAESFRVTPFGGLDISADIGVESCILAHDRCRRCAQFRQVRAGIDRIAKTRISLNQQLELKSVVAVDDIAIRRRRAFQAFDYGSVIPGLVLNGRAKLAVPGFKIGDAELADVSRVLRLKALGQRHVIVLGGKEGQVK